MTPEDLQELARNHNIKWSDFEDTQTLTVSDIRFTAGIGIYLNNTMAAVAAKGCFVALKPIPKHIAVQVRTEHEEQDEMDVEITGKDKDGKEFSQKIDAYHTRKVPDLSVITPDNLLEKGKPLGPLAVTAMWHDPIIPNDE